MHTVAVVIGTRPEAIKMAPVIRALGQCAGIRTRLISTGQHRALLRDGLEIFGLRPDLDLGVLRQGQSLAELTARLTTALDRALDEERPDLVLVHGDTTTTFVASLSAYYRRIPVGHVEAGLRSRDLFRPFPEEANRHLTGVLASLHFAPTEHARRNLRGEGVPDDRIWVTGNTVIDALAYAVGKLPAEATHRPERPMILATLHRRESWGEPLQDICRAIRDVLDARPAAELVLPVHGNPAVREAVVGVLGGHPRAALIEPQEYLAFVGLMRRAHIILTDSGGLQEEAPALGRPVLVARETTERPEAVEAGCARLVGTDRARITAELLRLLDDSEAYQAMARVANPFGDGRAAARIVAVVRDRLAGC